MKTLPPEFPPAAPLPRYSAKRSLHLVDFFCRAPRARRVCLVGDFNEWQPTAHPMQRLADGGWMIRLALTHGHHQYLFLVDGTPTLDPTASGIVEHKRQGTVSLRAVS